MSLRSPSVIELQQPTQPFTTFDWFSAIFFRVALRGNELVSDALMITLKVVVSDMLIEYVAKRSFAEENHSIQTFRFDSGAQ